MGLGAKNQEEVAAEFVQYFQKLFQTEGVSQEEVISAIQSKVTD